MNSGEQNQIGFILLVTMGVVAGILVLLLPIFVANKRKHSRVEAITMLTFLSLLLFPCWFVAMVWAFTEDNNSLSGVAGAQNLRGHRRQDLNYTEQPVPPENTGPGMYEIIGVDRKTKMDTTWFVQAISKANALAKAELEGILVTDIKFVV
jgi:hypothetical protein